MFRPKARSPKQHDANAQVSRRHHARQRLGSLRRQLHEPSLLIMLGVQIVLIFCLGPAISLGMPFLEDIAPAVFLPVVLVVVLASREFWPAVIVVGSLLANAIAIWFRIYSDTLVIDYVSAGATIFSIAALTWVVAGTVFSEGRMNVLRLTGAIVMYLNVAILFTAVYRLIARVAPGSFSGISVNFDRLKSLGDLMYFSMSTLTTVGYGDIAPVNPIARSLANLEALIGQLYPAIIVARIVTLYTPKK
jgi:hypothetical protein